MYPGSKKETLWIVYLPPAPSHVIKFFNFLQTHITLDVTNVSMEGKVSVCFRESRYNLANLMEKEGYDYNIYQCFVDSFEEQLLLQHYEK